MSTQQSAQLATSASSSIGVGPMTATKTAERHYTTGLTRENIERALTRAGKMPRALSPVDLVPLEDFHSLGRIATVQLIQLADVSAADRVLDAGTGIGGTARLLAADTGCHVTAVDLTAEYCETADWRQHRRRSQLPHRRPPRGRDRSPVRRRHLRGPHQPARPDERRRQITPLRRGTASPDAGRPPRALGRHGRTAGTSPHPVPWATDPRDTH